MSRVLAQAEASFTQGRADPGALTRTGWLTDITSAMVDASALVCQRLEAKLMVLATRSGRTALALSKQSSLTPTLALSDDLSVARAMSLFWGVMPVYCSAICDPRRTLEVAVAWGIKRGLLVPGDRVVFQLGTLAGNPVHNAILVHTVEGTEGSAIDDVEWRGGATE
jgi:pyruvate kinase